MMVQGINHNKSNREEEEGKDAKETEGEERVCSLSFEISNEW